MRARSALAGIFLSVAAASAMAQNAPVLKPLYTGAVQIESPTSDLQGNVYFSGSGIWKMDVAGRVAPLGTARVNGIVFDGQSRLIAVGRGGTATTSSLLRVHPTTGDVEVLAAGYRGVPFAALNDVTIDGKGRIWFTDDVATPTGGVYRRDPDGRLVKVLGTQDVQYPNGLMVAPDDRTLYVIETNGLADGHRRITAFDLSADGSASRARIFHNFFPGRSADGMTVDSAGNIWAVAGLNQVRTTVNGLPSTETLDTKAGLYHFAPDGRQLGFFPMAEDLVTNAGFGGSDLRTLYVAGGKTLYSLQVTIPGTRR
jgi:gluconolactonase